MTLSKQIWSVGRFSLPGVGFALMCIGAYLLSLPSEPPHTWWSALSYIVFIFGSMLILAGVFWTICHSMKSKVYQRRGGNELHVQVYTIQRPSSFPPSYEESQASDVSSDTLHPESVVVLADLDVGTSLAPPLYSADTSVSPDCTWSWERPPRYSQVEHVRHGQGEAEEQREDLSLH